MQLSNSRVELKSCAMTARDFSGGAEADGGPLGTPANPFHARRTSTESCFDVPEKLAQILAIGSSYQGVRSLASRLKQLSDRRALQDDSSHHTALAPSVSNYLSIPYSALAMSRISRSLVNLVLAHG